MRQPKNNVFDRFCRSFLSASTFVERAYRAVEDLDLHAFRMRKGIGTKRLIEEILPIAAFIKVQEVPSRRIRCKVAPQNQGYDAEIRLTGVAVRNGYYKRRYYLEVTRAVSPTDYLEPEALTRNGFVFGGGDIRREGNRKTGRDCIVSNPKVVNGSSHIKDAARWISERIEAKSSKKYPRPCILIIDLDAESGLSVGDWAEIVANVRVADHVPFEACYVVDWSANTVFAVYSRQESRVDGFSITPKKWP